MKKRLQHKRSRPQHRKRDNADDQSTRDNPAETREAKAVALIRERYGDDCKVAIQPDGYFEVEHTQPREVPAAESEHVTAIAGLETVDRAADVDELNDVIELSFSSEAPIRRWGADEVLSHDPEDADFSRLIEVGAILKNHDPRQIVGTPSNVLLDTITRKGRLQLRFGTTGVAKGAKREVMIDKSLRGVSVGYAVHKEVYLPDADTTYRSITGNPDGGTWVITRWQAYEASLTPIPADPNVGVGRSEPKADAAAEDIKQTESEKEDTMTPEEKARLEKEAAEKQAREEQEKVEAAAREAAKVEAERRDGIADLCERHGITGDDAKEMVRDQECTLDKARAKILDLQVSQSKTSGTVEVVRDEKGKFARAAVEQLRMRRGNMKRSECEHGGEALPHMSLFELAKESLRRANIPIPSDARTIVSTAMAGPKVHGEDCERFARGADTISGSGSDFAAILATTAYKTLLAAYAQVPTTYESWCSIGSVSNFQQHQRIKISDVGELKKVLEGGKYEDTAVAESQNPQQVYTYALKWNMSRQAIINDDLDAFTRVPAAMARRAAQLPNVLAIKLLLSNPTLSSDSTALFADTHSNLNEETDYALTSLSNGTNGIKNMVEGMMKQTENLHAIEAAKSAAIYLAPQPVTLLTPVTGMFVARQVLASVTDASQNNANVPNAVQNIFTPVVEPLLENTSITGYSSTAYYGFADPNLMPVIEVAFLNGNREPFMEETDQTDADGRVWKIRQDVGVAAIDYIGAYKETGVDA